MGQTFVIQLCTMTMHGCIKISQKYVYNELAGEVHLLAIYLVCMSRIQHLAVAS